MSFVTADGRRRERRHAWSRCWRDLLRIGRRIWGQGWNFLHRRKVALPLSLRIKKERSSDIVAFLPIGVFTKCKKKHRVWQRVRIAKKGEEEGKGKERKNALRRRDKLNGGFIRAEKTCRVTQGKQRLDNRNAQTRKIHKLCGGRGPSSPRPVLSLAKSPLLKGLNSNLTRTNRSKPITASIRGVQR